MSAWAQLEQLLTCAICLDRFRNPKLLPCQHTFCGEPCMDGLIDYARRQIKCPECRAEHRIPYNGVQSFPNNVTLSRFLDLHRSITGEEPDPLPSQMDRCGVCGEKSFCLRCAHCEKKVCEECRAAHLDIMRREINRLNTQVRRGLGKLAENVCQFNKSGDKLVQLSAQIQDEITEGVRRLIRDLKDKESKLLAELEEFSVSEAKNSEKLKEDLEQELDTITSNCELVEAHITETDEWTDAELMEYKEIFLKTLDFLRNLDPDTMDFARKIKYIAKVDLENVRRTIADFGEIKIIPASCSMAAFGPGGLLSPSESTANLSLPQGSLSRSQSDHRLVAQLAKSGSRSDLQRSYLDVTGGNRYGSDSDRERGSSPPGKRGERFGSVRSYDDRGRYASAAATAQNSEFNYTRGWQRPGDTDYEPSNSSNFRSRFMRERIRERGGGNDGDHSFEEHEDTAAAGPRVRFQEEEAAQSKKAKLFDTEEMASLRAPLSGLIKLTDSPHFMERLHQNEAKAKLKAIEEANEATAAAIAPAPVSNVAPRPTRQVSEDEIEKQKKQAQAQAAAQSNNNTATPTTPKPAAAATTTATTEPPQQASNRRVQALQKEDTRSVRSSSEETSIASDETGGDGESATQEQQSSPPVSTRRRMFASSRANTSGNNNASSNGQKNSYSNDYNDSGNATRTAAQSSSAASSAAAAAAAAGNTPGNSYYQSPYYSTTLTSSRSNLSRYGNEDTSPSSATATAAGGGGYQYSAALSGTGASRRKVSRDEEGGSTTGSVFDYVPTSPSYQSSYFSSQFGSRRSSLTQRATGNTTDDEPTDAADRYGSGRKQSTSDRYTSPASYYRNLRLAKSRSSHALAYEDSDDDNATPTTTNPLSPLSSPGYRSRFTYSSRDNLNSDRPGAGSSSSSYASSNRRTSRSGYTYKTREPSPEDDSPAGSVTQYLIKKYGSHSAKGGHASKLSKSKSSHVIFGRSLSSSDEDVGGGVGNSSSTSQYLTRRASRDSEQQSSAYHHQLGGSLGYPRQTYLQKRHTIMKIGSRGTNPNCFTWPRGVACAPDTANIVVADSSNHRVQVFDSAGRFKFEIGKYGNREGEFDCLAGVTVNRLGHYIVSDRYNHRIQIFDSQGRFMRMFGSEGRSDGKFSYPWGIATDQLNFIYVCDKDNNRIQIFQSDGTFVGKFGTLGNLGGNLEHPHYIAVSNTNRIIVSDTNNHRVQVFDINGRPIFIIGEGEGSNEGQFKFPRGVAVDDNGFIIVGDYGNNRVQIFNPDGTFLKSFGSWGSSDGEFKGIEGVAISPTTNNILVCERENHRIQIF